MRNRREVPKVGGGLFVLTAIALFVWWMLQDVPSSVHAPPDIAIQPGQAEPTDTSSPTATLMIPLLDGAPPYINAQLHIEGVPKVSEVLTATLNWSLPDDNPLSRNQATTSDVAVTVILRIPNKFNVSLLTPVCDVCEVTYDGASLEEYTWFTTTGTEITNTLSVVFIAPSEVSDTLRGEFIVQDTVDPSWSRFKAFSVVIGDEIESGSISLLD